MQDKIFEMYKMKHIKFLFEQDINRQYKLECELQILGALHAYTSQYGQNGLLEILKELGMVKQNS